MVIREGVYLREHPPAFLLLLVLLVIIPNASANVESLHWGVEEGYTKRYDIIERYWGEETGRQMMTLAIEQLPDLSNQITNWSQLPSPEIIIELENGIEITDWIDLFPALPRFVLPTGNWSLITGLAGNKSPDWEVDYDSQQELWELTIESNTTNGDWRASIDYSQSEGVLWNYHWRRRDPGSGENIEEVIVNTHYEPDYTPFLLFFGGYLSILTVAATVLIHRVRKIPRYRIDPADEEYPNVQERMALLTGVALFAPYLIVLSTYANVLAVLWQVIFSMASFTFSFVDAFSLVFLSLFTFPRYLFVYQVYSFYKGNTPFSRTMWWGVFSILYSTALFLMYMFSTKSALYIPTPLLVLTGYLLMKREPKIQHTDWLEGKDSQSEQGK